MGIHPYIVSWRGFLRSQRRDVRARLCWQIGGGTAAKTDAALTEQHAAGKIDDESLAIRRDALADMESMFASMSRIKECPDIADWRPLGNGAYQRRNHIHGKQYGA